MAKKLKRLDDQQTAEVVRMSSQEIWQAGLSAFAKAQEEEGKFFSMQLFEERVLRALSSIGVPTAMEVEALTRQVAALGGVAAPAKKPAATRAATAPAAKKAAAPAKAKPARAKTAAK